MSKFISVKEYYVKQFGVKVEPTIIQYTVKTADNVVMDVPKTTDNADYRSILEWVKKGNTIEPADE